MESSNIKAREIVRRVNESVKQFYTVIVIAVTVLLCQWMADIYSQFMDKFKQLGI